MEENTIPPKKEWPTLSKMQLIDVKIQMMSKYYAMKDINASFAGQYEQLIRQLETLIEFRENNPEVD